MNYTLLYISLSFIMFSLINYIIIKLRDRNKLSYKNLIQSMRILNLPKKIFSELRLDKEIKLLEISKLVIESLEFSFNLDYKREDIINNAYIFAISNPTVLGKDLTKERKILLKKLIEIEFDSNYSSSLDKEL